MALHHAAFIGVDVINLEPFQTIGLIFYWLHPHEAQLTALDSPGIAVYMRPGDESYS